MMTNSWLDVVYLVVDADAAVPYFGFPRRLLLYTMQQFTIEIMWYMNFLLFLIHFFLSFYSISFLLLFKLIGHVQAQVHAGRSFPCFC